MMSVGVIQGQGRRKGFLQFLLAKPRFMNPSERGFQNGHVCLAHGKTRPQLTMQIFAVMVVFKKLKSTPPHLGLKCREGSDALSHCLQSSLAAVTNQGVQELYSLVEEGHMEHV